MIRLYYCLLLMGSNSLYYARIYNINLGGKKNNMGAIEILLISIGLAMDAFAVSVCKGLAMKKMNWKKAAIIGLYFGIFQAVMPVIGYFLGTTFEKFITYVDHWVAFILLVGIGINMVKEAFNKESENRNDNVDMKTMLVLSIATSIDALAIGITFACLKIHIVMPVITIGLITFIISVIGVKIGNRFGNKYEKKAEIMGGVILILLGIKILLEHCGIERLAPIFNESTGKNEYRPLYKIASSKLARKTHVDMMNKVQIDKYAAGLHSKNSNAVNRYTSLSIKDRFVLMCAAFECAEYKVDEQLNII